MKVYVKAKSDKINNNMIKYAVKWFGHMLMNHKLCAKLTIHIENDMDPSHYGEVEEHYSDGKRTRIYTIRINPKLTKKNYLHTLAHEMSHVKQYATGELREGLKTRWKGEIFDERTTYYDTPWEIDAYGREHGLYYRLCKHIKNNKLLFIKPEKFYKKNMAHDRE